MNHAYNCYLLTVLPPLGEPGATPPLSPIELRARAIGSDGAALVDAILLQEDLRLRQSYLAGEIPAPAPTVLSSEEVTSPAAPVVLGVEQGDPRALRPEERVWEAYWRHVARVARRRRSALLSDWCGLEVALRNALARARSRASGSEARLPEVAAELARVEPMIDTAIAAWSGAPDPLAGFRSLLRLRWDWVTREEPRYTFSRDEVAAYALKLMLLREWRRTMGVAA